MTNNFFKKSHWTPFWVFLYCPHFWFKSPCICIGTVSPLLVFVPLSAENSTNSTPSEEDFDGEVIESELASQPLVPMCVLISHHILCRIPPSSQSFCTSCGSRDSVAFGLFPLPCAFSHFLAAFSFSLDGANSMSRIMLYLLCRSFTRCRSILRWKNLRWCQARKWNHLPYELSQNSVLINGQGLVVVNL